MTQFQHQQPVPNFGFSKPVPAQQNGQTGAKEPIKTRESRSFNPRPAH